MDDNESEPRSILMRISKNFTTVWFTIAMDTGVLSIILHQFPYPSHWSRVLSTILFVATLVLSIIFICLFLIRWVAFRRNTSQLTHTDAEQIALQAAPSITWLLLTIQVQLTCAQSWGYGWTVLAYVMWWMALPYSIGICVLLLLSLIKHPSHSITDKWLPTAIFIPIVGIFTQANAAGLIVNGATNQTHLSATLAVPIIIVGFLLIGFGLGLGAMMYAIYMHRLMTSGFPESLKIPSMILTIGAAGQSSSALLQLSAAAVTHANFRSYDRDVFLTASTAPIIHVQCILSAMLLLGFAIFWMCVDYYALIEGVFRRTIPASLFWWSSIFPVGTVVTALAGLGTALDSNAFRTCAVILFVVLVIIYVANWIMTIPMTLNGKWLGVEFGGKGRMHGLHRERKRVEKWWEEKHSNDARVMA